MLTLRPPCPFSDIFFSGDICPLGFFPLFGDNFSYTVTGCHVFFVYGDRMSRVFPIIFVHGDWMSRLFP